MTLARSLSFLLPRAPSLSFLLPPSRSSTRQPVPTRNAASDFYNYIHTYTCVCVTPTQTHTHGEVPGEDLPRPGGLATRRPLHACHLSPALRPPNCPSAAAASAAGAWLSQCHQKLGSRRHPGALTTPIKINKNPVPPSVIYPCRASQARSSGGAGRSRRVTIVS